MYLKSNLSNTYTYTLRNFISLLISSHSKPVNLHLLKPQSAATVLSKGSCSSIALSIISNVEFHLVLTSKIRPFGGIPALPHCLVNFSRHCGDARILAISFLSYSKSEKKKYIKSNKNLNNLIFNLPLELYHD